MENEGIHILSADAKDIYLANHYISDGKTPMEGYRIRYQKGEKKGRINTKKFNSTLDASLDLFKIKEEYRKAYRNHHFSFKDGSHEYTTYLINVTFQYSDKEFNKAGKNIYVKSGYDKEKLIFHDHVCLHEGRLIAIETEEDVEAPIADDILGKYFYLENGQYHARTNIKTLHTVQELRTLLYTDGFYCDGKKYVRYKRSGGSAREGKCLFIDEGLYRRMMKWSMCGLHIKKGQEVDLAGLEAHISLPLSSIIGTLELKPENFLIIDDYESVFREDVVETRSENGWLVTDEQNVEIRNSIWDGQSLLDVSLFEKYPGRGMLLLRNKFFKSACFNCNIQTWFRDNNISEISQLNGFTVAEDIRDIKIITTPSSVKYMKYGTVREWFQHISPLFGIVKHEKATHFFQGRMVQTHYQLLNTLQLTEEEIEEFLTSSLDYLYLLKTEPAVLRYHIRYPENTELKATPLTSKNDVIYRLLGLNNRFADTKLYHAFKSDLAKAYVKNLRCGHVLVNGSYATLLGNPVEMLLQAIGAFDGTSRIGVGHIHTKQFAYQKQLLGSRSPHVTIGNVWLPTNVENEEIDTYFNLSKEIAAINSIGESILDRLSGSDFDSDTSLLTDNPILIRAATRNYPFFKVPVNHVSAAKRRRTYTRAEQADLDARTSNNKIGDIVNLSQELNTILWDKMNHGGRYEDVRELYYDICQLDVMSGIEIDKAKKEYTTDTYHEMKKIKEKWILKDEEGRTIKPNFFRHLAKAKGYYNPHRKNYQFHATSMDYLQKVINRFQSSCRGRNGNNRKLPFSSIINMEDFNIHHVYYKQVDRVLEYMENYHADTKKIFADDTQEQSTKYKQWAERKQQCFEYIGKLKFNRHTMIYLLLLLDSDKYKKYAGTIMNILFGYPNTSFYELIEDSKEHIDILMETETGNIQIFDRHFEKIPVG